MAFSRSEIRKILTAAGVSDENIEDASTKLVNLHISVVEPLKSENDTIGSKDKTIEKLKSQLETAENELETLKNDDYKAKYEKLTADNDKLKKEYESYKVEQGNKEVRNAKIKAFKSILADAGIPEKHYDKIVKYSDIDSLELDDKGAIKTAKDVLKGVKEEWSDHIIETKEKGSEPKNPPVDNAENKTYQSKADIMKITDSGERQAAMKAAIEAGSTEFNV